MRNKILIKSTVLIFCFASLFCCKQSEKTSSPSLEKENEISSNSEPLQKDGWTVLFNGENLDGWHVFNNPESKGKWKVEDGTLHFDSESNADGGDIVTDGDYENFEFMLDWKISECGNSGIMWGVQENGVLENTWHSAPEMQVLDNSCHPDAKIITHRAGDLYDLISCSEETVKPAGEWNSIKIIANDGKYKFYQNGVNVVSFEMFNDKWEEMVANSKFKTREHFGKYRKGKFALQDHSDDVWYRNIKIKEI